MLDVQTIAIVVYTTISLNSSIFIHMYETGTCNPTGCRDFKLYDQIRNYLKDKKLDIIHEEKEDNFWDLKAHKGTRGSVIIGNVRDVEVMISGGEGNYDLILRTGAWGKDIVVPAVIAGVLTAGVGAVVAGGASAYRAHAFEKHFWDFVQKTL